MLGIEDAETGRTDAVHKGFEPKVYRNIVERVKLSQNEFQNVTLIPVSTIKRRLKTMNASIRKKVMRFID